MFSRNLSKGLKLLGGLFISSFLGLASCTPRVGEQPPDAKAIELSATKCFNKAANDLRDFFEAKVNDQNLDLAWKCVESAFLQFDKYVVGKERDRYTSQEIVSFIENNFFEDTERNKFTPELQIELMRLKQIFIGGNTEYVTRDELKRSQAFFQKIAAMTKKVNPHMKIIVLDWKPQLDNIQPKDLESFEKANAALQEFAVELASVIGQNVSLYDLNNLIKLFNEFEKFFNANWDWVKDIENLVPGAKKLKKALAGGDENTINQTEWNPVLTLGARGYFQYLRYRYFIQSTHETGGAIRLVYVARTLEDVFSIFQDLVSQKAGGAVTSREIYEILHAFEQFWDELKVSEKLIHEFMKIKQVLIGGSVDDWTAEDFEQARLKVPELRRIIENFMPYFSVYAFEWDPEMESPDDARETFEMAQKSLSAVAEDFGKFFRGPYSYDDLIELVDEMNRLYPTLNSGGYFKSYNSKTTSSQKESKGFAATIKQYRDVFLEAKKMLYNQTDTIVYKEQWSQILPLVGRVFSIYQYYDYFLTDKSWKQTRAIKDLGEMVHNSTDFAGDLLKVSVNGYFTQDELVSLTLKISETDLFNEKLKAETTTKAWTALLQHILFAPERRLRGEKNDRLGVEQFQILESEFNIWMKTQIELNEIFDNNTQLAFTPPELMKRLKDRVLQNQNDPELKTGLEGVYSQLDSPISMTWDSEDHLEISNRFSWQYRLNAVFQANLTRALTRLLMRSFSNEPTLHRVNKCETQEAFEMLAGVFRDLKIFDPQQDFVNSRFMEANIFMSRGNGDKFLDYFELGDLINVIFSGLRVNSKLEKSLRNICPVYTREDGKEFVTFACMSEHHYVMVRKFMTQLPDFKAYVDKLATKDKGSSTIMRDLEDLTLEQPSLENEAENEDSSSQQDSGGQPGAQDNEDGQQGRQQQDSQQNERDQGQSQAPKSGPRAGFKTWNTIFKQTLKATGWKPNKGYGKVKEEAVLFDEALYYPFIVQYIELLYSRFDYTKNGYLQSFEAKKAFPTFKPLLKDLAEEQIRKGFISESDLISVFTFILRYKQEPGFSTILKWLTWKGNEDKWEKEVWVGRTDIAQILGFIADKTRDSGGSAPVCTTTNSRRTRR